ncbi:MAG TPA: hypothetical protein VJ276_04750 [Thermoanaerobaculia bacterium]|nr:hypothetical protein [Thermoanaerobaculia bacterium]
MTPGKKKVLATGGGVAGVAALVGAAAHVGQYQALGLFDTRLNQAARAAKEFVPDGIEVVVGTLTRLFAAVLAHPVIAALFLLGSLALLWCLRRWPSRIAAPAAFMAVFLLMVVLVAPAFEVVDLLRVPPDPARVPPTRFARLVLQPVLSGIIYSRVRPAGHPDWNLQRERTALSLRYAVLVAAALLLFLLQQFALPRNAPLRRAARALLAVAVVGASYYYGAIEQDTRFRRTFVTADHVHPPHAAFLIATVGKTCSVYSFDHGTEDVDAAILDTDEEDKHDILFARLQRP